MNDLLIKFEGDFSDRQFEQFLVNEINGRTNKNSLSILFSENNRAVRSIIEKLNNNKNNYFVIETDDLSISDNSSNLHYCNSIEEFLDSKINLDVIVCVSTKSHEIHLFFEKIISFKTLRNIRFVYKFRGKDTYPVLNEFDQWQKLGIADSHVYITSQFDDGLFDHIYRYTLTKVQQKCQVRDALDLFQCLENIKYIEGDIIEFGTYEGHSGLIIAEFIKRKNIPKKLYLCDTFNKFPKEFFGVDQFWSDTHSVDFKKVKSVFENYSFVKLFQGEIAEVSDKLPIEKVSLAFIDCDSYRATKHSADYVFQKLTKNGIIVFEDYGHHGLLGARKAIDEFTKKYSDQIFYFFSFFSGILIVIKMSDSSGFR